MRRRAFTLIELLIVVAIISILAAVAVPNFLEAQTRSKVARVRADLRTLVLGLESYHTDNGKYPRQQMEQSCVREDGGLPELTTPIAYITTYPLDVFEVEGRAPGPLKYFVCSATTTRYHIWSVGPDRKDQSGLFPYDPTNGTTSIGDVCVKEDNG